MEKHIQLAGILNIVYRSVLILVALLLLLIAACFRGFFEMIVRLTDADVHAIPPGVIDIVPAILVVVAICMSAVSIVGIVAAAGVLGKRKWGRVLMLVVSFFNLLRIPVGTLLGGYTIWVLLNDETIKLFDSPRTTA
jgi:hypothetical protein